jgi:hypothetical protein
MRRWLETLGQDFGYALRSSISASVRTTVSAYLPSRYLCSGRYSAGTPNGREPGLFIHVPMTSTLQAERRLLRVLFCTDTPGPVRPVFRGSPVIGLETFHELDGG